MPTLQPAEFDNSPVSKQSIIQAPISYEVAEAPAPSMIDYMGETPSVGSYLSMAPPPEAPVYTAPPAPPVYTAPPSPMDLAWQTGAPPMSAPSPSLAYASPSSRIGAPR